MKNATRFVVAVIALLAVWATPAFSQTQAQIDSKNNCETQRLIAEVLVVLADGAHEDAEDAEDAAVDQRAYCTDQYYLDEGDDHRDDGVSEVLNGLDERSAGTTDVGFGSTDRNAADIQWINEEYVAAAANYDKALAHYGDASDHYDLAI